MISIGGCDKVIIVNRIVIENTCPYDAKDKMTGLKNRY